MTNKNTDKKLELKRCQWAESASPLCIAYHDNEWGKPVYDDRLLFEMLTLEIFQSGLSWECIINKRESFRKLFDNFVPEIVALYNDDKVLALCNDKRIVRNRLKITSTINNAKVFLKIQKDWGSFSDYIWHWTDNKIITERNLTSSELSDTISKDLKKRGMKFIGSTVIYSYLQAIGVIFAHDEDCFIKQ